MTNALTKQLKTPYLQCLGCKQTILQMEVIKKEHINQQKSKSTMHKVIPDIHATNFSEFY